MIESLSVDFSKSQISTLKMRGRLPQLMENDLLIPSANQYIISKSSNWSGNTLRTYSEHLFSFHKWLHTNNATIQDCDENSIPLFIDALCSDRSRKEGLSWQTIDKRIRVATNYLMWCATNNFVIINESSLSETRKSARGIFQRKGHPKREMSRPTRWVKIERALEFINNIEEMSGAHSVRNGLIARLMLEVGLRVDEVHNFSIETLPTIDERYDFAVTNIIGKGRKRRPICIPIRLLRDLHGYLRTERAAIVQRHVRITNIKKVSNSNSDPLFLSNHYKSPSVGQIQNIFRSAKFRSGISITPHMLRHTFGTYHYHINKDLPLLREIMGHSDMEITAHFYVSAAVLAGYSKNYSELIEELTSIEKRSTNK